MTNAFVSVSVWSGVPGFLASLHVNFAPLNAPSGQGESRVLREGISLGKMRILPFRMWTSFCSWALGLNFRISCVMDWLVENELLEDLKFSITTGVMCWFSADSCLALFLVPELNAEYLCVFVFTMSEYVAERGGRGVCGSCPLRRICSMVVRVACICVTALLRGVDWVYLLSSEYRWLSWSKMFFMMRLSIFSLVGEIFRETDGSAEVRGFWIFLRFSGVG